MRIRVEHCSRGSHRALDGGSSRRCVAGLLMISLELELELEQKRLKSRH
jgi:hypothetical protein